MYSDITWMTIRIIFRVPIPALGNILGRFTWRWRPHPLRLAMTRCFRQHPAHWQCVKHLGSCRWSYIDGEWRGLTFTTKSPMFGPLQKIRLWWNTSPKSWLREQGVELSKYGLISGSLNHVYIYNIYTSLYSLLGSSCRTRLCHLSLSKCSLFTGFRPHTSGRRFLGKNSGHAKTASVFCLPYLRSFVYIISGGWFRNSFMRLKCLAWKSIFLPFCLASTLRLCHLVAHWWIRLVIQYSIKILK